MKRKNRRMLICRILLGVLIVCNMAMVFLFSSQNAIKSAAVSQKLTISIIEIISKYQKEKNTTAEEATTPAPEIEPTTPVEPPVTTPSGVGGDVDGTEPVDPPLTDSSDIGGEATTPEGESGTTDSESGSEENTTTDSTEPPTTDSEPPVEEEITTPEQEEPEDPMENLTEEQVAMVNKAHTPIRKLAHMTEFGTLAMLTFLLLLTWQGKVLWRYATSLGFTLLYAASDELHQLFSDGRGARLSDVAIDFTGAFITCTLLLIVVIIVKRRKRLVVKHYDLAVLPEGKQLRIGLVTDLHACPHNGLIDKLRSESPDIILLAGDLMEASAFANASSSGYEFLRACAAIAPTYYSFGNHETIGTHKNSTWCRDGVPEEIRTRIAETGVTLLYNESVLADGIRICGLSSGLSKKENRPNEAVLAEFANAKEFRILLCHHPEYYEPYIRSTNIELIVSGHAHGGQWRFFGRGIYAPGPGIFPKYTAGVVDGRLVISRGAGDHTLIPRIANPRELVVIQCTPKKENE